MKTARKLNRYVSSQAYGGGDAVLTIDVGEIPAVPATSLLATGAGAVSIGVLLGPIGILIGTVIGGLLSIFQRKKQERELAQAIDEMITQVAEGVRPEVLRQLNLLAEQFFAALFEKVEAMKMDKLSQIGLLEEQLTKNKAETDEQRQVITADLVELAKLEEAQAAATLQAGAEPCPSLLP